MVVCQFYLRDQCKFGSTCRNEHPVPKPSGFNNPAWGASSNTPASTSVTFNVESMQRDFGPAEKPLWPLSSYGVGKYEPSFLSGLDISPEELRVRAVEALKEGKGAEYSQYEANAIANANAQFARVTSDGKGAFEAAFQLSKSASGISLPAVTVTSPSAHATSAFGGAGTSSAFGSSTFGQPSTSAFGQSAFGQSKPATFGASTSAFGQPSTSTSAFGSTSSAPAFGQSAFGTTSKPAFGTSAFGQPATSAFGASTNAATSGFGASTSTAGGFGSSTAGASGAGGGFAAFAAKPAGFGQPAFGQSGFGALAASATGGTPAFAQPDPAAASAFGTAQPFGSSTTAQPFGSSATAQPFGSSAFGASTTTNPLNSTGGGFSAFASSGPSAFGTSTSAPPNPFGQSQPTAGSNSPSASTSAFGGPASPVTNPFVQPAKAPQQGNPPGPSSAFGQSIFGQPAATSAFGQPSQPTNPFGQPAGAALSSGFGSMELNSSTPVQNATPAPANPFGPRPGANPLDAGSGFGTGATAAPVSVFGASTTGPSAFGSASSASSVFGAQPQASGSPSQPTAAGPNIFTSLSTTTGVTGRPIQDPYASLLPPNYLEMLPKEVKDAFASDRFVFGDGEVGVPWWIPPLEMR